MTSNKKVVLVVAVLAIFVIIASLLIWGLFPWPPPGNHGGANMAIGPSAADPAGMPGLIGRWKLDEEGGMKAKDSSGLAEAHDGTLVGNPASGTFNGRKGLDLNGSSQYVSLGNILRDGYPELTIACWIKHPASGWQNVVERGSWDRMDGIGLLMDFQGNSAAFGHYSSTQLESKSRVQDNEWHHLAGTLARQGSEYLYRLYVDGQLDNTLTSTNGLEATTQPWAIGARHDGSWCYRGLVSDVRIYNRALTAAEVTKLFKE